MGPAPAEPVRHVASLLPSTVLAIVAVAAAGGLVALQLIPVKSRSPCWRCASAIAPSSANRYGRQAADHWRSAPAQTSAPSLPSGLRTTSADPRSSPCAPLRTSLTPAACAPIAASRYGATGQRSVALEDLVSRVDCPAVVSIEAGPGTRQRVLRGATTPSLPTAHVVQSIRDRLRSDCSTGNGARRQRRISVAGIRPRDRCASTAPRPNSPCCRWASAIGRAARPGSDRHRPRTRRLPEQRDAWNHQRGAPRRSDGHAANGCRDQPGYSGGPLLNRSGQVVGINTMKISGAAESLGFAVAVDHARSLLSGGAAPSGPIASSAQPSRPLAPSFSARSETDAAREDGTRQYTQIVESAARRAAQIHCIGSESRPTAPCAPRRATTGNGLPCGMAGRLSRRPTGPARRRFARSKISPKCDRSSPPPRRTRAVRRCCRARCVKSAAGIAWTGRGLIW